jgi:hypothetical protein
MFLSLTIEKKDRVFVPEKPFQPARVEHLKGASLCAKKGPTL